tara:strand:- start:254 stop:1066 length:813 start_codon:yes stop_codon:yes gene_type:complete
MKVVVSALIAVHKGTTLNGLKNALISLASQDYKKMEIIIVIDGPIDKSLYDMCQKYATVVKVLKNNVGLGRALNEGLKSCKGKYIARLDCDDICLPGRITLQADYLNNNTSISVVSGQALEKNIWAKTVRKSTKVGKLGINDFWLKNQIIHPASMIRKVDLQKAGCFPGIRYTQDFVLWLRMLSLEMQLVNLSDELIDFGYSEKSKKLRTLEEFKRVLPAYREMYLLNLQPFWKITIAILIRLQFYVFNQCVVSVLNFLEKLTWSKNEKH